MSGFDERLERAAALYEAAVFGGDNDGLAGADRDLDGVEADLALARGRILHARFLADRAEDPRELELFERAAQLYRALGEERGLGEALFWVGIVHQVVRGDNGTALPAFTESYRLASQIGDLLTMSYATRHLGFADQAGGDLDAAWRRQEESVRLRREVGFDAGVAAGLLALAQVAHEQGRDPEAVRLLDEAEVIAVEVGAHGIRHWISVAHKEIAGG